MPITTYIKQELGNRIRTGQELPAALTLSSLADHYQVSLTPVRAAVSQLIEEGLLQKGPNRRLAPVAVPKPLDSSKEIPAAPEPPRDPFQFIADDLVQLSLNGEPIFLREEKAAEKYHVSRSVVRNVFHRMAGTGILEHVPRRGWRLRPFRQEDLQAYLEVREVLELKAMELAWPRLQDEKLQRLLDGNVLPTSDDDLPKLDNSLHAYIIDTAGNDYIKKFFESQGRYHDILFDWEGYDREAAIETVRQHRQILESLLKRDRRAAQKALAHHIRSNHPILGKIISARTDRTARHSAETSFSNSVVGGSPDPPTHSFSNSKLS